MEKPIEKGNLDLFFCLVFTIIGITSVFGMPDGHFLRTILSLPSILFIPGYLLISILWPGNSHYSKKQSKTNLKFHERTILAVGLSIAMTSVVGLILGYLKQLNLMVLSFSFLILSIVFFIGAWVARNKLPEDERYNVSLSSHLHSLRPSNRTETITVSVLIVIIMLLSSIITYSLTRPITGESFSEFYMLDANRTTSNIPNNLSTGQNATITVGIISHESTPMNYTIRFGVQNSTQFLDVPDWAGTYNLSSLDGISRNVTLSSGESFEGRIDFLFGQPGTYKVSCTLLLNDEPSNYEVHFWVHVE